MSAVYSATRDGARGLRAAAGAPLEWDAGVLMPLDRLALTALLMRWCRELDIPIDAWDSVLGGGGSELGAIISEELHVEIAEPLAESTFGELVESVEAAMHSEWEPRLALLRNDPAADAERALIAAIRDVLGEDSAGDIDEASAIEDAVPARVAHEKAFWIFHELGPVWQSYNLPAPEQSARRWWTHPVLWKWIIAYAVVAAIVWFYSPMNPRIAVFVLLVALLFIGEGIGSRLTRPVWPDPRKTLHDYAIDMANALRADAEAIHKLAATTDTEPIAETDEL